MLVISQGNQLNVCYSTVSMRSFALTALFQCRGLAALSHILHTANFTFHFYAVHQSLSCVTQHKSIIVSCNFRIGN
jgi:hypothetical protein